MSKSINDGEQYTTYLLLLILLLFFINIVIKILISFHVVLSRGTCVATLGTCPRSRNYDPGGYLGFRLWQGNLSEQPAI